MNRVQVKRGDMDFRGYETAREQFFTSANMISATFSRHRIRFSSDCVRRFSDFGNIEYIELLVHPENHVFIVRSSFPEHKNAMRWAKTQSEKIYCREISGIAFLGVLYDLFNWDYEYKYRLRGKILKFDNGRAALFNIHEPEVILSYDMPPLDGTYITARTKRNVTALPLRWQNSFGKPYYSRENIYLHDMPVVDVSEEYDNQPEINPTSSEKINDNIQQLLVQMQESEKYHGNTSNYSS